MYKHYNPNPIRTDPVGDCTVRALSAALDTDWETAHVMLDYASYMMGDISNSNAVMAAVLRQHGFYREAIPNTCPDCYSAREFVEEHPNGVFVLGTGTHFVTVKDGEIYDSWNSSDEIPQYYFYRKEE